MRSSARLWCRKMKQRWLGFLGCGLRRGKRKDGGGQLACASRVRFKWKSEGETGSGLRVWAWKREERRRPGENVGPQWARTQAHCEREKRAADDGEAKSGPLGREREKGRERMAEGRGKIGLGCCIDTIGLGSPLSFFLACSNPWASNLFFQIFQILQNK